MGNVVIDLDLAMLLFTLSFTIWSMTALLEF
jgi:hypothetical protein